MKNKVSVIIPLYNHEAYIKYAISSVLNQTIEVFEIIVIDDGSKDKSGQIVQEMARNNEKIKYFYQENCCTHNAINRGINMAKGDFIAILNSDDLFKNDKIERCLIIAKEKKKDIVFGGVDFIDGNNNILKKGISVDWQKRAFNFFRESELFSLSILNENFVSTTSNIFFKKSAIKRKNVFYPLRYCHDLEFIIYCLENYQFYFDNDIHISYRCHESNTLNESFQDVMLEVAAVVAVTFCELKMGIINNESSKLKFFNDFLRNKKISDAIIYLMLRYLENPNKEDFYSFIFNKSNKDKLRCLLN